MRGEQKRVQNFFAAILWVLFHFVFRSSFSWIMKRGDPEVRQMSRLPLSLLPAWTIANRVVVAVVLIKA